MRGTVHPCTAIRAPTQGAHYREKSGKTGNFVKKIPAGKNQGIWKKWVKSGKIREFYKNMSGKYQGIFSLFHNLKKITQMMLYI